MNNAHSSAPYAARQAYWTEHMDHAADFVESVMRQPVEECGEAMVSLREVVEAENLRVLFSESRIAGRFPRCFYLRSGLIPAFTAVAEAMNARVWVLKVEDGYRSPAMQQALGRDPGVLRAVLERVLWETSGHTPNDGFIWKRLTALIATCAKIGTHISGSAIDISVIDAESGLEVDRGAPYLEFSERTPMDSPFVNAEQAAARAEISTLFAEHDFVAYPFEFWHYNQGDVHAALRRGDGQAARYGPIDFDPDDGRIIPVDNPTAPLHDADDFAKRVATAFAELRREGEA